MPTWVPPNEVNKVWEEMAKNAVPITALKVIPTYVRALGGRSPVHTAFVDAKKRKDVNSVARAHRKLYARNADNPDPDATMGNVWTRWGAMCDEKARWRITLEVKLLEPVACEFALMFHYSNRRSITWALNADSEGYFGLTTDPPHKLTGIGTYIELHGQPLAAVVKEIAAFEELQAYMRILRN